MAKKGYFWTALGAGLAAALILQRQQRRDNMREWQQQRPGTAFITGASSGIGAAFARALAGAGYNLVLVARREERLRALADELQQGCPVKVEVLAADLSDPVDVERVAVRIAEVPDLDLLINNAGFGTGGDFATLDIRREINMIRLHVEASVALTHAALPGMIARNRGGIINTSSIASLLPMPGNATYGSTKAYLNFFTESLDAELAGSGVRVEALLPGFTYSEFHDVMPVDRGLIPGFLWMPADEVARAGLQGLHEGRKMVIPGLVNQLLALVLMFPLVAPLARIAQRFRLVRQWKGVD